MNKSLTILIITIAFITEITGQGMWHDYGLDIRSYEFGKEVRVDSLKKIILNGGINSPLGQYSKAVKYLYYKHRDTESQFLLDNLNTKIDTTLPYFERYSQWDKYYTDAYILGLLGDRSAISKMDTVAQSTSHVKKEAITKLAEAGFFNYYDFVKDYYLNTTNQKKFINGIYVFSLYGRDSRYTNEVRSILEQKARAQTNWRDIDAYASYIGNFDYQLYVKILNDHFENSQGKERYDCFFHLGRIDGDGQPERTIFALQNEINDSIRAEYIPYFSSIKNYHLETNRYLEPKFINSLSKLSFDTTSSTYKKKKYFLNVFEPPVPDSTFPNLEMLDTLTSYTNQCYGYEWLKDEAYKNELLNKITNAKDNLTAGDSIGCRTEVEAFQNSINQVYQDSAGSYQKYVSEEGYKFLYYYAGYILDRLPEETFPPNDRDVKVKAQNEK